MAQDFAIGIDLGGTQIRAALVSASGEILQRIAMPTPVDEGPLAVLAKLHEAAVRVAGVHDVSEAKGIGVACPGPLDTKAGVALGIPTLPGFVDFPIGLKLNELFGRDVSLAHDGIAAAVGEWRFGSAKHCDNFVYVTVSTGIGGGVVSDGRVVHGRKGMAGHIGHMTVVKDGVLCNCGRRGCWEAYASGPALERRAAEQLLDRSGSALSKDDVPVTAKAIFEAAAQGDGLAQALVAEEAEFLGVGIVNLLHIFDPQCVVLGGGIGHRFEQLLEGITRVVLETAMPAFRDIPVLRAKHIGNSGLIGAAAIALREV